MTTFCRDTKFEVERRVVGKQSEISGRIDRPIEYMHKLHGRGKYFDQPENCLKVTDIEHLAYHLKYYDKPAIIGLTKAQNNYAIRQIAARVVMFSYEKNRLVEYDDDLSSCLNGWDIIMENSCVPTFCDLVSVSINKKIKFHQRSTFRFAPGD